MVPAHSGPDAEASSPAEAGLIQVNGMLVFLTPDPARGAQARLMLLSEAATKASCRNPPGETNDLIGTVSCSWKVGAKCASARLRVMNGVRHRFGAAVQIRSAPKQAGAIGRVEIVPSASNTVALGNVDALVCS